MTTKIQMVERLSTIKAPVFIEDTGNDIMYAMPSGIWASLYCFPGGEVSEETGEEIFDRSVEFGEELGGYLFEAWEDMDQEELQSYIDLIFD